MRREKYLTFFLILLKGECIFRENFGKPIEKMKNHDNHKNYYTTDSLSATDRVFAATDRIQHIIQRIIKARRSSVLTAFPPLPKPFDADAIMRFGVCLIEQHCPDDDLDAGRKFRLAPCGLLHRSSYSCSRSSILDLHPADLLRLTEWAESVADDADAAAKRWEEQVAVLNSAAIAAAAGAIIALEGKAAAKIRLKKALESCG